MSSPRRTGRPLILGIGWPLALAGWFALGAAEPVKLAIILAQTGIGADENLPALKTARMAVEEINGSGGFLGRSVELVVVDNASTPLGSRKAAEYAVSQGVIGVIGPFRLGCQPELTRVCPPKVDHLYG